MEELQASRTLVKSPPELWAECSDAAALARHLGAFGEIRITRLEPETAVAWEGDRARGTVRLEPTGWGTKVVLTAVAAGDEARASPGDTDAGTPPEAAPEPRRRRFRRVLAFLRGEDPTVADADAPPKATDAAADPPGDVATGHAIDRATDGATDAALAAALDSLGQAHHRPFSRA